jgi:hypothetical protein
LGQQNRIAFNVYLKNSLKTKHFYYFSLTLSESKKLLPADGVAPLFDVSSVLLLQRFAQVAQDLEVLLALGLK